MTTNQILQNVNTAISRLEEANAGNGCDFTVMRYKGWSDKKVYRMEAVFKDLSIFDWWNETLSLSQLKQMKKFLETAIKLGFTGYACFKVGAAGCSHGMWAYTDQQRPDGYSPDTGDTLFHSFRSGDNYWDAEINGEWLHDKYATEENRYTGYTLKQLKEALAA